MATPPKPTFLPPLFCPNPADNSPTQTEERWLASATGMWLSVQAALSVLNTDFPDAAQGAAYKAEAAAWLDLGLIGLRGMREAKIAAIAAQQAQQAQGDGGAADPGATPPDAAPSEPAPADAPPTDAAPAA